MSRELQLKLLLTPLWGSYIPVIDLQGLVGTDDICFGLDWMIVELLQMISLSLVPVHMPFYCFLFMSHPGP